MSAGKALLAVLTTTLVVTAALFSATTTASASTSIDLKVRAAQLAAVCSSTQSRVDRLVKCQRAKHRPVVLRKMVIREDKTAIRLTKAVRKLNRAVLKASDVDASTRDAVLDLNTRVLHLDADAVQLSEQTLPNSPSRLGARIQKVAKEVRALDKKMRSLDSDTWSVLPILPGITPEDPVTPVPEPAPTVEPTPTPSDTPTTTFTPTTTISGRTFTTYTVPAGTHDVVYEDCTFTGGGSTNGVLTINRPCYNIVFRNCTIDSGPVNGVSVVDAGGTVHDIRFEGCHFLSSARMGFECISRPPSGSSACYRHIDLIDCTFEPQGSEAISYDSAAATVNARGYCLIDGVVIKGSGTSTNPAWPWGEGLEFNNVHNMTVRNTTIYRTRDATLNLDTNNTTFTDCNFDQSVNYIGRSKGTYEPIFGGEINNCVFTRCTFEAGNQGTVGSMHDSVNNDFRSCTFSGTDDFHKRVLLYSGCSGNLWPSGTVLVRQ